MPLLDAHNFKTPYEIFTASLVSAHCASFMSRWPLLRGGGGVCISVVETGPVVVPSLLVLYIEYLQARINIHLSFMGFNDEHV